MVHPIVAYGHPVLKKVAKNIEKEFAGLEALVEDMYETMYHSHGVGLAAPQINRSLRLIVLDASAYDDEETPTEKGFKKVFVNPVILEESGDEWLFSEGCLSIPGIHEEVSRRPDILVRYQDMDFNVHEESYTGVVARIIQHEYDHLAGVLFVERLSSVRRMFLKKKLHDITTGQVDVGYKMIFPTTKKKKK